MRAHLCEHLRANTGGVVGGCPRMVLIPDPSHVTQAEVPANYRRIQSRQQHWSRSCCVVSDLIHAKRWADAARVTALVKEPQAVWFASGTPSDVKAAVQKTMNLAKCEHRVPILVAYNVPFRDCSQYSAGGATDTAAYKAWIDGFAAGIGNGKAVVILEPDALGIIPYNTTIFGAADWCKPTVTDASGNTVAAPGASSAERYAQINYAVDSIVSKAPQTSVYLDGTQSAWLGLNDSTVNYSAAYAATVTAGIQSFMGSAAATTHFVIDTSRNGQGPQNAAPYAAAPYNQPANVISGLQAGNWCNPLGAGAGLRPTANTGQPLLDAYLWVKTPGQSDGSCDSAGGARAWDYTAYNPWNLAVDAQSHFDPLWGLVDPAAGAWFPQQAMQLAQLANPPLF